MIIPHLHDWPNTEAEAVALVHASCAKCDWGASGREAVVLRVLVDDVYSQHLVVARAERDGEYRLLLGRVASRREST